MTFNPCLKINDSKVRDNIKSLFLLVPSRNILSEFHSEVTEPSIDDWMETITYRNAVLVTLCGVPSGFEDLAYPLKEGANDHLNIILSDKMSSYMRLGLGYEKDNEFTNWLSLVLSYIFTHWYDEETNYRLYFNNFSTLSPLFLLKYKNNQRNFQIGKYNTLLDKFYDLIGADIKTALKLVNKIKFKGYDQEMFEALTPINGYSYIPVMDVINHYINLDHALSETYAARLLCLYFSPETIVKALKS